MLLFIAVFTLFSLGIASNSNVPLAIQPTAGDFVDLCRQEGLYIICNSVKQIHNKRRSINQQKQLIRDSLIQQRQLQQAATVSFNDERSLCDIAKLIDL